MNGKNNYLLDTNVVLGFLNGNEKINEYLQQHFTKNAFNVSQITRMELLGFPGITPDEENSLLNFLSLVKIISINDEICEQAILIRRKSRLKLPDAMIAATAMVFNLTLLTNDSDLLIKIDNLNCISPASA